MMLWKTIIGFVTLISMAACSKESKVNSNNQHSSPHPDAGSIPKIKMSINVPRHLRTSLKPNLTIFIYFGYGTMSMEDAHQWVSQNAIIETYPGQKPVAGKWSFSEIGGGTEFTSDSELAPGDYLLRFPKAGADYVFYPRPCNLFRVGSALRIAEVGLLPDKTKAGSGLSQIHLIFSEVPPKSEQVAVTVQQQAKDASWGSLSAVMENQNTVALSQAIDPSKPLRLSITSPSLDGKWTGKAGSGPLEVAFVPSEHQIEPGQVQYFVIPDLAIKLPEGTPK